MIDQDVLVNYGTGLKGKLYKRLEFNSIARYAIKNHINLVYIRTDHNANPFTINLVKKIKKAGIHIVMEIPTYPYDQEYTSFFMKVQLFIDKCSRQQFAKYLDKIITFSNYTSIFGISTLQLSNGIDFDEIPVKQKVNDNPHYNVYFHIVGEFTAQREREECIPIIKNNHLEPFVILHGQLHGASLDILFERCDLGVGSLGRHRSGITNIKTLKNREYAARGIPFIYSEIDEDFETMPYIMKIPANESSVDIQQVINFHNKIDLTPTKIRESIKQLSWKEQMKKVITSIKI